MRVLKGHTGKLRAVAYSPDGTKLATAGDAGVAIVWDVGTGHALHRFSRPETGEHLRADEKRVTHLIFSRDGKLLVTGTGGYYDRGGRVRFWDVNAGHAVAFTDELNESAPPMAFTLDDATLILAQGAGVYNQQKRFASSILAWNRKTGAVEGPFVETTQPASALAVSPAADLLAIASDDSLRLWNLTGRTDAGKLGMPKVAMSHLRQVVQGLAFAPDGRALAVSSGTQVRVFDVPNRAVRETIGAHDNEVAAVAYSPDGRLLATAAQDGTVRLWDAAALTDRGAFDWGLGKLRAIAFAPDGLTMAVVGDKSRVVIFDVDAG